MLKSAIQFELTTNQREIYDQAHRNAKVGSIGGGTNEIRRIIIAEELLRTSA